MVAFSLAISFLGCLALVGFVLWLRSERDIGKRLAVVETAHASLAREWTSTVPGLDARVIVLEAAPKVPADLESRLTACERATKMRERFVVGEAR